LHAAPPAGRFPAAASAAAGRGVRRYVPLRVRAAAFPAAFFATALRGAAFFATAFLAAGFAAAVFLLAGPRAVVLPAGALPCAVLFGA
jgi:hypothetical protein